MSDDRREPLPIASLVLAGCILAPIGAFALGFIGYIGSLHHAAHVALLVVGIELVTVAAVLLFTAFLRVVEE